MTRGQALGRTLVAALITCAPGLAGVVAQHIAPTGDISSVAPGSRGDAPARQITPSAVPAARRAVKASRSRAPLPAPTGTHLDWHALALCESSDNPRANTGNGYYGLYQFDLSTWRSVGGSADGKGPQSSPDPTANDPSAGGAA